MISSFVRACLIYAYTQYGLGPHTALPPNVVRIPHTHGARTTATITMEGKVDPKGHRLPLFLFELISLTAYLSALRAIQRDSGSTTMTNPEDRWNQALRRCMSGAEHWVTGAGHQATGTKRSHRTKYSWFLHSSFEQEQIHNIDIESKSANEKRTHFKAGIWTSI